MTPRTMLDSVRDSVATSLTKLAGVVASKKPPAPPVPAPIPPNVGAQIMQTLQDIETQIAALKASVTAAETREAAAMQKLQDASSALGTQITALQGQVADLTASQADPTVVTNIITELQAIQAQIDGQDASSAAPAPVPDPTGGETPVP